MFEYFNLIPNVITSIIVVGGTLIVVSIVVSMAAYAFSKLEFPHKQAVYYLILTGMMIPTSALIFPLYQIVRGLHLNNTGWSLVFPYATASACFNLMVLTNYYNALPDELIDAAKEMIESSNFTSASQKKLEDAVAKAEDVLTDGEHTSAELEKAYNDVIDAIINLERKGNKAALSAMIEKAEEVLADKDAYVASTIDGLDAILANAKAVNENEDATQNTVDNMVKTLTLKVADARLKGDVDGDGSVGTSDSASLLQYAAEKITLDDVSTQSADVNGDGAADTQDAAMILQYAAEEITSF